MMSLCSRQAVPPRWGYDCVVVYRAAAQRLGSNHYCPLNSAFLGPNSLQSKSLKPLSLRYRILTARPEKNCRS
jgi:hypothetical protein